MHPLISLVSLSLVSLQAQLLQQHRSSSSPLLCVHALASAQHCATSIVKTFLTALRSLGDKVAPKSLPLPERIFLPTPVPAL